MPPSPPAPTLWQRLRRNGVVSLLVVAAVAWGAGQLVRTQVQSGRAEALRAVAGPGDIRMISSLTCFYCTQARQFMTEHRIAFEECYIERDAACRTDYERLGAAGTPTLLIRGERQLGFDINRIVTMLGG